MIFRSRNRAYRDLAAIEERDSDADGIPDLYEATTPATTGSAPPTAAGAAGTPRGGASDRNRRKVPIFLDRHSDSAALPMLILVSTHKYLDALTERVMQGGLRRPERRSRQATDL